MFKSTNAGATWTPSGTGLTGTPSALAVVPNAPQTLYAGTGSAGVFKSTDGGASWSPLNTGLTNLQISALAVDSTGTCLHAGTSVGVFDFATEATGDCPAPPELRATLSPKSLSVPVGTPVMTVATIENLSGASTATPSRVADVGVACETCGINQITGAPTLFRSRPSTP